MILISSRRWIRDLLAKPKNIQNWKDVKYEPLTIKGTNPMQNHINIRFALALFFKNRDLIVIYPKNRRITIPTMIPNPDMISKKCYENMFPLYKACLLQGLFPLKGELLFDPQ